MNEAESKQEVNLSIYGKLVGINNQLRSINISNLKAVSVFQIAQR